MIKLDTLLHRAKQQQFIAITYFLKLGLLSLFYFLAVSAPFLGLSSGSAALMAH